MKIATFDLETSDLKANFGIVLCGSVKYLDNDEVITFRGDEYTTWHRDRYNDKALVVDIVDALREANILVAHNGVNFDLRYLNTRLIGWGLRPIPRKMVIDPCLVARKTLRLHSNSLDAMATWLGAQDQKTAVTPEIWRKATLSLDPVENRFAMDYIVDHCERDVRMLEEVYQKVTPLLTKVDSWGSAG